MWYIRIAKAFNVESVFWNCNVLDCTNDSDSSAKGSKMLIIMKKDVSVYSTHACQLLCVRVFPSLLPAFKNVILNFFL